MKYNVTEQIYDYETDDYHEETVEKTAVQVYHQPHNYSSEITVYFLACDEDEVNRIADEINDSRESQYDEYANVRKVPYGYFLEVIEPYDD